ncbi:MAG: UV DNA damage repair endonuclease UvsE [Candidatus Aminicenantes bacterium]|nr:UV DNA damage repair endonuclease UvsE [Candidatus Aminicenantes bacterium]
MKIGYPCLNRTIGCTSSHTFRLRSYSPQRLLQTVRQNLECLKHMLEFNHEHGLLFFRISSDLVPFASHPVCHAPWPDVFAAEFETLGTFIKGSAMRISMHPDQFTLINSPNEDIFRRSAAELEYHARVLDLLELDRSAKIQIHGGGVYGDKAGSMDRFCVRFERLAPPVRRRLVVENDDRQYGLADCLNISRRTGIPVLFDSFHHQLRNQGEGLAAALRMAAATWKKSDGLPMVDYSAQKKGGRSGSHTESIDLKDFSRFIQAAGNLDFDIMLEIKDKEKSALRARRFLAKINKIEAPFASMK